MRTFAISDTNDFVLGHDGRLSIVAGLPAVLARCKTAMQAQLGEMQYAADQGMPYMDTAFRTFNPAQFEAAARVTLESVTDVVRVESLSVTRANNKLTYAAIIVTTYGTGELTNG